MATFTEAVKRDRSLHNGYTVVARPEGIGERIARLRRARGWSTQDLARHARLAKSTVGAAETGGKGLMAVTLVSLATALGVSMDYLWTGEGEP